MQILQHLALLAELLQEIEHNFAPFDAMRDLRTICNRAEHEGMSFLTITLPSFFDDVLDGISNGSLGPASFPNFKKRRGKPVLFSGLTDHMFDSNGVVLDFDARYLKHLRQICLLFKKVGMNCSKKRVDDAYATYVSIEENMHNEDLPEDFQTVCDYVVTTVFSGEITQNDIIPKPGPGAVFEMAKGNGKYRVRSIASSITEFFGDGAQYVNDIWCHIDTREISAEKYTATRVTDVPKTLKTPRIIAIEPCWTMMYQQGLKELLYSKLESHGLTKGHVNFRDQTINQNLALEASKTGCLATIDLSEASDRVSNTQVQCLFRRHRFLCDALQATRTGQANLPCGRELELKKFASMGSATCFPVEALIFFCASITGILRSRNLAPAPKNIRLCSKSVWVYGDDIILPPSTYNAVSELFTSLGWKVNLKKSFYKGFFRESCGLDAYKGEIITPIYLRTALLPERVRESSAFTSLVETSNLFFEGGYTRTSEFIITFLGRHAGRDRTLYHVDKDTGGIGSLNPRYGRSPKMRWNNDLHRIEQWALVLQPIEEKDHLEGHAALFKTLTHPNKEDGKNLEFSSVRRGTKIHHGWIPINEDFGLLALL